MNGGSTAEITLYLASSAASINSGQSGPSRTFRWNVFEETASSPNSIIKAGCPELEATLVDLLNRAGAIRDREMVPLGIANRSAEGENKLIDCGLRSRFVYSP
jgi:hypothetical protein